MQKCCHKTEKEVKKQIALKIYHLTQNVMWENEAEREGRGRSFIKPDDLKRLCDVIERIIL